MPSLLTQAQRRTLFATVREAASRKGEQPEAYRRRVMADVLGVEHLSEVSNTTGYDALMARFCLDAGDQRRAEHYAAQPIRRLRYLILAAASRIAPADPCGYVAGVMIQSRLAPVADTAILASQLRSVGAWLKLPVPHLRRVLMMLKTHLRRQA